MDIKQLKAAVQLAKLRVGSDPSDANKAKLEHAQNEYDNALDPTVNTAEKKTATVETEDEPNPNKQPVTPKPSTKAAPAKPKTEPLERQPLENHPLKTTRTVPEQPQTQQPQPEVQPETPEAK